MTLARPAKRDDLTMFASYRLGAPDPALVVTTQALHLQRLQRALGCRVMVDHGGLEAGKVKRVYAACSQARLEAVLERLRAKPETRTS